jgi:flavin reductase (DIM6/NTAB) family NADH-FMN oxidoreductase RutF
MSLFTTGITVITARREDDVHGMTANSFTAVSLDPPLALICVAKSARMAAFIHDAPGFAVNILAAGQEGVSRQFAGARRPAAHAVELLDGPVAPLIAGALATISCMTEAIHEGGDHWIVIGRVIELREHRARERPPLVFFRARYCELLEPRETRPEADQWSNEAIRIYHDEWSEGAGDPVTDTER